MNCDLCDQKATVFLTQIVDGHMQKVNLCNKCAEEKGVTDPTGFSLADLLLGIGKEERVSGTLEGDLRCPKCGFDEEHFKKTGRLGCSHCYTIFSDGLQSLLKAMQKGARHEGKRPKNFVDLSALERERTELKRQLEEAIEKENFEEAARLRDTINQFKED